ncbi:MAG TPA: DUF5916 domain-containing protein, partial [Thermoanaerobaculia bacterium]|nr:DUF5916 domain-containing protein [Thermoanaerobaculia bacterium]
AFEFFDPQPGKIRAPYGDRDNVPGYTDYGGVILDTRNDGKTGLLLLANPRGIQYDAVADDTTGNEDSSPDFYWDSAAKITKDGWVLEMRVPFSSLRYPKGDPQTWNILLYRNYPREYRYQIFSAKLPRGGNCFVCRGNVLTGLEHLPAGGKLIAAPYATGKQESHASGGPGTEFVNGSVKGDAGLDAKWTPNENTALDATLNPDFSQIESDVAQISSNERFALFYPEKRPFFLEGIELFSTPIQAVYTRTITSPRWGARATGKFGGTAYTVLVTQDRGGGQAILPGPNGSDFANQDFRSIVAIGRVRHDLGQSFISVLATDREIEGGGHNRVYGPDFQWRVTSGDTVTGQLLFSNTKTPDRPDLSAQWDGRSLSGHAAQLWYSHNDPKWDWFAMYRDYSDGFRADDGFVPQVGFRDTSAEVGYTLHPTGLLSRLRTFVQGNYTTESNGALLDRVVSPGVGMDGRWSSFLRLRYNNERVRSGNQTLDQQQFVYTLQFTPSSTISQVILDGFIGQQVDFANSRAGHGGSVYVRTTIQPTDHLQLQAIVNRRWLDVDPGGGAPSARLFTADVARLKAVYTFTARAFVRVIGQYVRTESDPSLYTFPVAKLDGRFSGSVLLAYKINWQTVCFVGYGDNRTLTENNQLLRADRQLFLKLSYAFQL